MVVIRRAGLPFRDRAREDSRNKRRDNDSSGKKHDSALKVYNGVHEGSLLMILTPQVGSLILSWTTGGKKA
jgi:hypothetical protein